MSEIKVSTLNSGNTFTNTVSMANGAVTINSTAIAANGLSINTSVIKITSSNSSFSTTIGNRPTFSAIAVGTDQFSTYGKDLNTYANLNGVPTTNFVSSFGPDYSIERSPAGGIPFKIVPSGADPYVNTWANSAFNIVVARPNQKFKVAYWVRTSVAMTWAAGAGALLLGATAAGAYVAGATVSLNPTISLAANTWTYYEYVTTMPSTATVAYAHFRLDGDGNGVATTWYDGVTITPAHDNTTLYSETVNTQIFAANGYWQKPSWATTGEELVVVHAWGGGGAGAFLSGSGSAGGGGGAFVYGYFMGSQANQTVNSTGTWCNVIVGAGGTNAASGANGSNGSNSFFYASAANPLIAYGGGGAFSNSTLSYGSGGGGWLSNPGATTTGAGGSPLGNTAGGPSTFGGGGGATASAGAGGTSVYGGGGGGRNNGGAGGNSIYGGGGGAAGAGAGGTSIYGGTGGNTSVTPAAPGGGGGATSSSSQSGARGEVRVYTFRVL